MQGLLTFEGVLEPGLWIPDRKGFLGVGGGVLNNQMFNVEVSQCNFPASSPPQRLLPRLPLRVVVLLIPPPRFLGTAKLDRPLKKGRFKGNYVKESRRFWRLFPFRSL